MISQHWIAEPLSQATAGATFQVLLGRSSVTSRTAFARRVRREFGFLGSRGQLQVASRQKALRGLHQARIRLPARRRGGSPLGRRPRELGRPPPHSVAVPPVADAVRGLGLTPVSSPLQRRGWNEPVAREDPHGAVIHVGAQLRYLIESEHRLLGVVVLAASALAVAARDK